MPLSPPEPETGHAAALSAAFAERAAREGAADLAYDLVDSPLGPLLGAVTGRGLVRLAYTEHLGGVDPVLEALARDVSPRVVQAPGRLDGWRRELDAYFSGTLRAFSGPLDWSLTRGFGRRILQATARIGYGATSTYKGVCAAAGSPGAFRAAGGALGANPIVIVVPCHRVLASGGGMGGYTGGLHRKELLLRVEGTLDDDPLPGMARGE